MVVYFIIVPMAGFRHKDMQACAVCGAVNLFAVPKAVKAQHVKICPAMKICSAGQNLPLGNPGSKKNKIK